MINAIRIKDNIIILKDVKKAFTYEEFYPKEKFKIVVRRHNDIGDLEFQYINKSEREKDFNRLLAAFNGVLFEEVQDD